MLDDNLQRELLEFLPRLRRFARSLASGDPHLGDDIAQSAVVKALENLHRFTPGTRLDSWMYRIAQNIWIDMARSERGRGTAVPPEELEQLPGRDGRDVVDTWIDLAATRRAIEELPDDQRMVVMLVLVDGMTYQDAAQALALPVGTVMSRLYRARASLTQRVYG